MKHPLLAIGYFVLFFNICSGQRTNMRPVHDLIDTQDPGWNLISQWKASATNDVQILPKIPSRADSALFQTQLTTNSPIAAMVYGCGGVLVDHGWIRILGSGCSKLDRSLPGWNNGKSSMFTGTGESYLLVADDVLGGFFAVNTGGCDPYDIGQVFYYGPNKLKWVTTGLGYNEFIVFCFSGDIEKFYHGFRWDGWKEEVSKLSGNEVISCYPLLWTDAGKDLIRNRKVVAVQKQWDMYGMGMQKKLIVKKATKKKTGTPPKLASK